MPSPALFLIAALVISPIRGSTLEERLDSIVIPKDSFNQLDVELNLKLRDVSAWDALRYPDLLTDAQFKITNSAVLVDAAALLRRLPRDASKP